MKQIFRRNIKIKVALATLAALVSGPALIPYIPAITMFLETMAGQ